jgi:Flp pilus assembly pilin Flp
VLGRCWEDEDGQDMVEYAIIVVLLSAVAIAAIQSVGSSVGSLWNSISSTLAGWAQWFLKLSGIHSYWLSRLQQPTRMFGGEKYLAE